MDEDKQLANPIKISGCPQEFGHSHGIATIGFFGAESFFSSIGKDMSYRLACISQKSDGRFDSAWPLWVSTA